MKAIKILLGSFLVILLTAVVYSFTASQAPKTSETKDKKNNIRTQVRTRFCFNLSCAQQNANPASVLNPSNYTTPCAVSCPGDVCVCAILALVDGQGRPIIDPDADPELYNELSDFADDGDWDNEELDFVERKNS